MTLRVFYSLCVLLVTTHLCGCASALYGVYDDKRLSDTITTDKTLATNIKTDLLKANFSEGWNTSVFCYYGKVFLVGKVPHNRQAQAVAIARAYQDTRSVTAHWLTPETSESSDIALSLRLRTDLISAKGISSTRIDTYVDAGRVVLFGVVHDDAERERVLQVTKGTNGVKDVVSYLMMPQ